MSYVQCAAGILIKSVIGLHIHPSYSNCILFSALVMGFVKAEAEECTYYSINLQGYTGSKMNSRIILNPCYNLSKQAEDLL